MQSRSSTGPAAEIDADLFADWEQSRHHLESIWRSGASADLLQVLGKRLAAQLNELDDPDSAVANLDRFVAASRSPTSLLALFERDHGALPALLQVFSTSQTLANRLISDPESFDLLRASDGQPAEKSFLIDELVTEVAALESPKRAALALRKFARREIIRIAYGEFVRQLPPESVGRQLSFVADAVIEASLRFSWSRLCEQYGEPQRIDGSVPEMAIIGLGHLGGEEICYGSPLKLLFLYDSIEEKNQTHRDFMNQLATEIGSLVGGSDDVALDLAVDTSFRPLGEQHRIGNGDAIIERLESDGRTWQRLEMTKARVVAGSTQLGERFLSRLRPWIYRRFMSRQDFADVRSIRRKLLRHFESESDDGDDVTGAPGGRHDIELMMQFLQLLHGGESKSVRVGNTGEAIDALQREGCLTHQEATLLAKGHARLCRLQHQLSVMFGRFTSRVPNDPATRKRLAWQLGVRDQNDNGGDLDRFERQLVETFELNRKVLNHLMVEAPSADDRDGEDSPATSDALETELVLDPAPEETLVVEALSRHGLQEPIRAMDEITSLATESVRFLSTKRCRHFFAAIAPDLLSEIAKTPDPDRTLRTLARVADSIGGKASLWELLGSNRATMELMVRMCVTPYLSDMLVAMPGMIDELIDSLVMNRLPSAERMDAQSIDLCRRAADLDMVLHGFKAGEHLMIGVRDLLGKELVESTQRALADTAEACVRRIAEHEQELLASRFGDPVGKDGEVAELLAVALGKFGGREPNYHSDLDVVFLYSGEGETRRRVGGPRKTISNAQFFNQLTSAIVSRINHSGSYGRLYELDGRLRPTGEEGVLAVSVDDFVGRFRRGLAPVWQRLALCKARVISGSRHVRKRAADSIFATLCQTQWHAAMVDEIREIRMRMEETASEDNLKRGLGGTVDVEFIAQTLTLREIAKSPSLFATGTIESLAKLADAGVLQAKQAETLIGNYRALRQIEANLRLMNTPARHELPEDEATMRDLAFLMQQPDGATIREMVRQARKSNRELFEQLFS
ncbi:MAG: glutamate-ammonia-ligase adenylyltransferase [Planctomycetota bacterium]